MHRLALFHRLDPSYLLLRVSWLSYVCVRIERCLYLSIFRSKTQSNGCFSSNRCLAILAIEPGLNDGEQKWRGPGQTVHLEATARVANNLIWNLTNENLRILPTCLLVSASSSLQFAEQYSLRLAEPGRPIRTTAAIFASLFACTPPTQHPASVRCRAV